jgi:hypothetical protein
MKALDAPQNRSASVDFRSNPWGDRIRASSAGPPPPPEAIEEQVTDFLATETLRRNISPERLGKTTIKHLDLKSMNNLLKGLPPSINSLLKSHTDPSATASRDWTPPSRRASSSATNHRRDVLTDAAEWSRLLDWLDSINMAQYSNHFRLGGVTKLSVVELLAPPDLIQIGVQRNDALAIIRSIQEVSRRTKSLTEEAMSAPPVRPPGAVAWRQQPTRFSPPQQPPSSILHPPPAPPSTRKLNLNSLTAPPPSSHPHPLETIASDSPLVTFAAPSAGLGLVSVPILLQSFDSSSLSQLLALWVQVTSNIKALSLRVQSAPPPTLLLQHMTTVDFYLRLHIAISPFRSASPSATSGGGGGTGTGTTEQECHQRMAEFKLYLDECFSSELVFIVALVNSRLYAAYAGVVMVPDPRRNPAYAALFDQRWVRALRARLLRFLELIRGVKIPLSSAAPPPHPQVLSPLTSSDCSDPLPVSHTTREDDFESPLQTPPLFAPPPPEPPGLPPRQRQREGQGQAREQEKEGAQRRAAVVKVAKPPLLLEKKKTKPVTVRKMTAVLGSGPLVMEEVQEEVTDEEGDDEGSPAPHEATKGLSLKRTQASPLRSVKELTASASSFIPIALHRQTTALETESVSAASSSSSPAGDLDEEAEDYDFSQQVLPRPRTDPSLVSSSSPPPLVPATVAAAPPLDVVETTEDQDQTAAPAEAAAEGYYDQSGNWFFHDYHHGYYDPAGEWHDTALQEEEVYGASDPAAGPEPEPAAVKEGDGAEPLPRPEVSEEEEEEQAGPPPVSEEEQEREKEFDLSPGGRLVEDSELAGPPSEDLHRPEESPPSPHQESVTDASILVS